MKLTVAEVVCLMISEVIEVMGRRLSLGDLQWWPYSYMKKREGGEDDGEVRKVLKMYKSIYL